MSLVLSVSHARKVYGPGCAACQSAADEPHGDNHCPRCGSIVALADASFELHRGEILGVMGESGSGKSTLVRLIDMDEAATSGRAIFEHEGSRVDLFALNPREQRRVRSRHLGVVY